MPKSNERGNWKNWFEFLFSCIGCLVGLGNIWRFPYLCYKNGGGAFLVPYFLFLFLCGLPLFFLEMTYSQYSNLGPGRVWICCPLFKGIGYGMVIMTGIVSIYYNVILAWTLYYLFMSCRAVLPWSSCDNDWNTELCIVRGRDKGNITGNTTVVLNSAFSHANAYENSTNDYSYVIDSNVTNVTRKTATEEFWERHVLEITDGVQHPGTLRWQLLLCMIGAWTVVFLCLIKGIKSSGKVVYVAATVPYLFLVILLIRGLTLPGAIDGLKYYLIPRFDRLLTFSVWGDAAVQMFYSAGLGWGGIATLSSYNNFHNNVYRDAIILPVVDCLTSWFAGLVIFVTLGFMSHEAGLPIDQIVTQGPGIAFMVYPEALSKLPLPQLWSVLFFLMLFTVGLDSQFVHVQTLTSAFHDNFPRQLKGRNLLVTAAVCLISFLLGLSCITQGGVYVLQIMDWYVASVSVMLLCLLETVVLAWVYGTTRLYKDLEMMIGYRPCIGWKVFWCGVTPVCILFVWLFSVIQHTPVKYGDRSYPEWAITIGWIIALISLLPTPLCACQELCVRKGTIIKRLRDAVKPGPEWRPAIKGKNDECVKCLQKEEMISIPNV